MGNARIVGISKNKKKQIIVYIIQKFWESSGESEKARELKMKFEDHFRTSMCFVKCLEIQQNRWGMREAIYLFSEHI